MASPAEPQYPVFRWEDDGEARSARWLSEAEPPPSRNVVVLKDESTADAAYGLACQGTALVWQGDFHNGRQMLVALAARCERRSRRQRRGSNPQAAPAQAFHLHRQAQSQRARTLSALLVPLDAQYNIPLRRAPDVRQACEEVYGPATQASLIPLRALLGLIGAHEWRIKGIEVAAIGDRIHPHYGVFAPIRQEYVDLVASTPLPAVMARASVAFDIGTGTGVLAAALARRGVRRVIATDLDPRALACAYENIERLGWSQRVEIVQADLFPQGRATLVVCNPPWIPARPSSPLERGIYDPESRMLRQFLVSLPRHLEPEGEGWLILSDLAEHLGLRTRNELLAMFETAGLKLVDRTDVRPKHRRVSDVTDPLHAWRAAEVTSLWRVTASGPGSAL